MAVNVAQLYHAFLQAFVLAVVSIVGVAQLHTHVTTIQSRFAWLHAATFRYRLKIGSALHGNTAILWVILAIELQCLAVASRVFDSLDDLGPEHTGIFQHLKIADNIEPHSGAGQGHTEAIILLQETCFICDVASHKRKQNDVTLFALKVVDGCNSDTFKFLFGHTLLKFKYLAGVWRQDGDLVRSVLVLEKIIAKGCHELSLMSVAFAFEFIIVGLRVAVVHEEEIVADSLDVFIVHDAAVVAKVRVDVSHDL